MCLAIPSEIIEIQKNGLAVVDTMGTRRVVSLSILPEPACIGDFVIVHVGYAIQKLDRENAVEGVRLLREIIDQIEKTGESEQYDPV